MELFRSGTILVHFVTFAKNEYSCQNQHQIYIKMSKKKTKCKKCGAILEKRPTDCKQKDCPLKSKKDWELFDIEVNVNKGFFNSGNTSTGSDSSGGGCLSELGGCLLFPFKLIFGIFKGIFKFLGFIFGGDD